LPCQIQIGGGENAWQEGKLVEEERAEEKERNGEKSGRRILFTDFRRHPFSPPLLRSPQKLELPTQLSVEDGLQR